MVAEERLLMSDTNIQKLTPSRKKPLVGDIFTMLTNKRYVFGRVIRVDAMVGSMKDCMLIYVFRVTSIKKESPGLAALRPENLLLPPLIINRLPWSRGYFEKLTNVPLGAGEVLAQHCFFRSIDQKYYDEYNNVLPGPVGPIGIRGLHSYKSFDDILSDSLGIARIPEFE